MKDSVPWSMEYGVYIEDDSLPPSFTESKKEWRYKSTHPYALTAWTKTRLHLKFTNISTL